MNDHLLHVDDMHGVLHLTLECRVARPATGYDVDPDACAAELDAWLTTREGRRVGDLVVCTTQMHHGDLGPITSVLAMHRPTLRRLYLGALSFPDFARGDHIPDDLDDDGSSWRLELPDLPALLAALPELEVLVVQLSDCGVGHLRARWTAPRLQSLLLRIDGASPDLHAALAHADLPRLETLELWSMQYRYGWGGEAVDLAPLLAAPLPELRRLALIGDLGDDLIDVLADSPALARLTHLDLAHGIITDAGAARLCARWSSFAHLRRLQLTGNQIGPTPLAALRGLANDALASSWQRQAEDPLYLAAPPPVSLFAGLFEPP